MTNFYLRKGDDLCNYMDGRKGSVDTVVINTTKPPRGTAEYEQLSRRGKGVG